MKTRTVGVGIASYEEQKARLMAIAKGKKRPSPGEPRIWFSSIESLAQVLSTRNRHLLEIIARTEPDSLTQLAELSGRKKSNLSRTLHTFEKYGLVELVRHGRNIAPRLTYQRLRIDLPLVEGSSPGKAA